MNLKAKYKWKYNWALVSKDARFYPAREKSSHTKSPSNWCKAFKVDWFLYSVPHSPIHFLCLNTFYILYTGASVSPAFPPELQHLHFCSAMCDMNQKYSKFLGLYSLCYPHTTHSHFSIQETSLPESKIVWLQCCKRECLFLWVCEIKNAFGCSQAAHQLTLDALPDAATQPTPPICCYYNRC